MVGRRSFPHFLIGNTSSLNSGVHFPAKPMLDKTWSGKTTISRPLPGWLFEGGSQGLHISSLEPLPGTSIGGLPVNITKGLATLPVNL